MKKLIAIIFVMLIVPSLGYSETNSSNIQMNEISLENGEYEVRVLCIDGYKFVSMVRRLSDAPSIVQMFEERDGKSLPTKC